LVSFYLFGHQQPYLGCHWHLPLLSASTLTLCLWGISLIFCSMSQTIWFLPCPHFLQGQCIHGFDASVSLLPPLLWPERHPFSSFSCCRRSYLPWSQLLPQSTTALLLFILGLILAVSRIVSFHGIGRIVSCAVGAVGRRCTFVHLFLTFFIVIVSLL